MFYRNNIDVVSKEGIEVDAHSLWKKSVDIVILDDDDQYATHDITEDFYLI